MCEGLEVIETLAFSDCKAITSLSFPKSVKQISAPIIQGGNCLSSLTVAEDNPVYKSEGNCIITKADNVLIQGCYSSKIPKGVTAIGFGAFYRFEFSKIELPEGIKSIGDHVFEASYLTEIAIPSSCSEIGAEAFRDCKKLQGLFLPNGVKKIKAGAFAYCDNLHEVVLPETVEEFEDYAFGSFYPIKIHTAKDSKPQGWNFEDNLSTVNYSADVVYDGNYPYLNSIKKEKPKEGSFSCVLKRKGYEFKGLTTQEGGTVAEYGMKFREGFVYIEPSSGWRTYIYEYYYCRITADELNKHPDGTRFYTVWEKKQA